MFFKLFITKESILWFIPACIEEKKNILGNGIGIKTIGGLLLPRRSRMMDRIRNKTLDLALSLLEDIQPGGTREDTGAHTPVKACIESVLSDPDTLHLLGRLAKKSQPLRHHALSCCVLSTCFGQYLGINGQSLQNLALGALLHDVGMLNIGSNIYDKTSGISATDMRQSKRHVIYGPQILANNPKFWAAIDVAHSHHESVNGTGYPRQLKGEAIPYNARIVAIVEAYDTMISNLTHNGSIDSPAQAMSALYRSMGTRFDQRLVEAFIRFLGVYPVGSLVEFDSGEVGVVIEKTPFHITKPKVALILDHEGNRVAPEIIDLYHQKADSKARNRWHIKALQSKKYDINISNFLKENSYRRD